jgi:MerR family transcriptional regulator, mercuric resistance operon regulatory protein
MVGSGAATDSKRFSGVEGKSQSLSIGALSRRTRVNIETIRYYKRIGLLPPPGRTEGGHRLYSQTHVERLNFIRHSRALGFPVDEIRVWLRLGDGGGSGYGIGRRPDSRAAALQSRR